MPSYVFIEKNNSDKGKLGISSKVFVDLANSCIKEIKEIKKDRNTQVSVSINNNTVNYKIQVYVKKGTNKDAIKDQLEEKINNSSLLICETVPFEINIKVIEKGIDA